jgi:hypothetical protein
MAKIKSKNRASIERSGNTTAPQQKIVKPPSPTWERLAKKHVMHRSLKELEDRWRAMSVEADEVSLQETVSSIFKLSDFDLKNSDEIKSFPGGMVAAAVELKRLKEKSLAAVRAANSLYNAGNPTWGSVDAYHASFLIAKVILGVFGIFIVSLEGKNFFLDLLPGEGDVAHRKQFASQNKGITDPARFMTIYGARIEHRHVWELLSRISNKCSLEVLDESERRWFKHFAFDDYHSVRNKIIYQTFYWSSFGDLITPLPEVTPVDQLNSYINYSDNLWMEEDHKDHILMSVLGNFSSKICPL